MLDKKLEKRRRKVQELILKGYSYDEIADRLKVTPPTIVEDVKALNERYQQLVLENPDYLQRQLYHVFEVLEELELVKKKYWELIENTQTQTHHKIQALDKVVHNISTKAKLLKLIQPDAHFIQNNYIHVDKLQLLATQLVQIVKQYVVEDKQVEALETLKTLINDPKSLRE